ncbi:MAG: prepilin-type N-terminal cleavage/methylation domain-containing protein [Candidatus Omnitrophota bacterium]
MRNYQFNNLTVEQFNNRRGVTLIEMIMAIVIVGVLVGVSSMYVKETIDLWHFLNFRSEVVSQGRIAMIRMGREIRQIRDNLSVYNASAIRFRFDDINGNNIDYQLIGNNLMRNSDVLASGVSSLGFIYYNSSNAVIPVPLVSPTATDIYQISITLFIQSGSQTKTLRSQIHPRNL